MASIPKGPQEPMSFLAIVLAGIAIALGSAMMAFALRYVIYAVAP